MDEIIPQIRSHSGFIYWTTCTELWERGGSAKNEEGVGEKISSCKWVPSGVKEKGMNHICFIQDGG